MQNKKPRMKHNYTSEIELKSILIRLNNTETETKTDNSAKTIMNNRKCAKYIELHNKIQKLNMDDYKYRQRAKIVCNNIQNAIIKLSERSNIDSITYEKFGNIILLMIKKILTKPNFSGYTYEDQFYSDSVFNISKYIHNFDHTKISENTNQPVKAFSYVSQIIHNSILFVIIQKKKEVEDIKKKVLMDTLDDEYNMKYLNLHEDDRERFYDNYEDDVVIETIVIKKLDDKPFALYEKIQDLKHKIQNCADDVEIKIIYPHDYNIHYDEYIKLTPLFRGSMSIQRDVLPEVVDE